MGCLHSDRTLTKKSFPAALRQVSLGSPGWSGIYCVDWLHWPGTHRDPVSTLWVLGLNHDLLFLSLTFLSSLTAILKIYFILCVYVCCWVYHMCTSACGSQKRALNSLEVELQVRCIMWMLGSELASTLNCSATQQDPISWFINTILQPRGQGTERTKLIGEIAEKVWEPTTLTATKQANANSIART